VLCYQGAGDVDHARVVGCRRLHLKDEVRRYILPDCTASEPRRSWPDLHRRWNDTSQRVSYVVVGRRLLPEMTTGIIFLPQRPGKLLGHIVLWTPVVCFVQKQRKEERRQSRERELKTVNCPVPVHVCSMDFWLWRKHIGVWSVCVKTKAIWSWNMRSSLVILWACFTLLGLTCV
jgi:hypothetical protein